LDISWTSPERVPDSGNRHASFALWKVLLLYVQLGDNGLQVRWDLVPSNDSGQKKMAKIMKHLCQNNGSTHETWRKRVNYVITSALIACHSRRRIHGELQWQEDPLSMPFTARSPS
jgi:hypothetical protein